MFLWRIKFSCLRYNLVVDLENANSTVEILDEKNSIRFNCKMFFHLERCNENLQNIFIFLRRYLHYNHVRMLIARKIFFSFSFNNYVNITN